MSKVYKGRYVVTSPPPNNANGEAKKQGQKIGNSKTQGKQEKGDKNPNKIRQTDRGEESTSHQEGAQDIIWISDFPGVIQREPSSILTILARQENKEVGGVAQRTGVQDRGENGAVRSEDRSYRLGDRL